ncbi:hypothetical protein Vretimale_16044 [Volvox reticuliferus]|uniref:Uncharacterized protein n=1 Tax=Volvox reticuliferus TaxID=1737510 RepID=A0A8J4CF68_9CHLO|nr:hypothetical protein Vretifemale_9718 [Volvox reticuliferus]GIM12811.1 hypothetical protein Vretimale_16044 [Volvox reticuliferus]
MSCKKHIVAYAGMEQELDVDTPIDNRPGFSQDFNGSITHLLRNSFSMKPRPPSGSAEDIKRKVPRPPQVLPRLLRQAPVGLNANLKGSRESETDDEYGEAADAGYGTSPTVKRTASPCQASPHLTSEQQALIFRCKPKPPRPSNADSDASLPAAASPTAMPLAKCQEGPYSVYSTVHRTSSCHLSDGMRTVGPELPQSPKMRQQLSMQQQQQPPSTLQRQSPVLLRQASMLQQQQSALQRQTQGSPHSIRQGPALIPSGALIHSVDLDGSSDAQYGCSRASAGSYDVRSLPSRSTTPTGRSMLVFHSRRGSHGWVGGPPATGLGSGSCGNTSFSVTNGLTGVSVEAVAESSVNVDAAISTPVVGTGSPAAYVLGGGNGSSPASDSKIRSPLTSPLSAPSLHGTQRLSICRSAFIQSTCVLAPVAPGSPQGPPAPVPPGTPSPTLQHSPSLNSHMQPATVVSANFTTPHGELAGSYGGGGIARSPSRRFLGPAGPSGKGAGGNGTLAGTATAQILERNGGGSSPLPKLFSSLTSGHSFSGPPRPTSIWPQSAAASAGNEIGREGAELVVTRRSYSAIAAVTPLRGAPDISAGSGRASTVLASENENYYEGVQGGAGRAAAKPTAKGAGAHTAGHEGGWQSVNLGKLLKEYEVEGPLSAAARQLAALHRAHEKSKALRGLTKGQPSERQASSSRWRSARPAGRE